jgi:putative transposase
MGLSRSTFYDTVPVPLDADGVLTRIGAICDEFECYGYRRVGAALRHEGVVVNGKKLRRLMREQGLQPKRRRRFVVTTDSDHGGPIFADLAKDVVPDRPNQLWVADLTYVAIPGGFVYLAAILDAWSRKVVGYANSRSMDARIAVAALKVALRNRAPPKGCIHHSDRGSQYASEAYRELLAVHELVGSMSWPGNPYDNANSAWTDCDCEARLEHATSFTSQLPPRTSASSPSWSQCRSRQRQHSAWRLSAPEFTAP